MLRNLTLSLLFLALGATAQAMTHDLGTATGLFAPSFRGNPSGTTWTGWDNFGIGGFGTPIVNQPSDLGTDPGVFHTTNSEDHTPFSSNFYSFTGTVAEDISFTTDGITGTGLTTVIVQALSIPQGASGEFPMEILFGDIGAVSPVQVLQATNATNNGQLWAKYEIPGNEANLTFSISTAMDNSHIVFDQFVVDTFWSPTEYAADTAIATPEPTAAMITLLGMGGLAARRRW